MHTYRFFTQDMLTQEVLGELPLYGVYMDKQLNQAGQFTGTFRLGTGIEDDEELINATHPQKCCIFCQRDGVTVWGGVIWSRTYGSGAKTIQLSAQTFESYMAKVIIPHNFVRNQNQLLTAIDLVDDMQSLDRANIGIDTGNIDTAGGLVKATAIPFYDYKFYGEVFAELAGSEDGFDYTINVIDTDQIDHPNKQLVLGQPRIQPATLDNVTVYDYPGSIADFYWPESGTKGGTDFIGLGRGTGSNMLVSQATWPGFEDYPRVNQVFSFKGIAQQELLDANIQSVAETFGPTTTVPTIDLNSDRDPEFDQWNNLGAVFQLELEAPRWPERKVFQSRMIGWEFKPGDSESSESIKLRIDGSDTGD